MAWGLVARIRAVLRRKLRRKKGIECPSCKDRLFSLHRHDMRYCSCKETFIDGGDDYVRFGFGKVKPRPIVFCQRDMDRILKKAAERV